MIDPQMVQQIQQASVVERLHMLEVILQSLKQDILTEVASKQLPHKPFTIRPVSLGEEVHVDRDELYAERRV